MVAIAQDAQGAEVVKPWVEKAGATFRTLLDRHNVVGKAYGLKAVPIGIFLDEAGRLARPVGGVNIDRGALREEVDEWVTTDRIPSAWRELDRNDTLPGLSPDEAEADARLQLAIVLLDRDQRDAAIAELQRAFRLDPANYLIRKQLWAIEHPEAFYTGRVDYDWQREQMAREAAALGQRPTN